MTLETRRVALAAALACTLIAVSAASLLGAAAQPGAADAAPRAKSAGNCFWIGPYTTRRGPEYNQAFPDIGAIYWTARYTMPAGATLRLEGEYAHARYQSLHSYGAKAPVDSLNDVETRPDRRSVNPFKPGARRTVERRDYTVTVSPQPPPPEGTPRPRNTLFAGVSGRPDQELMYRVYVPDKGRGLTGGGGRPEPVLTLADGTVVRGPAVCDAVGSRGNIFEHSRFPLDQYLELRDQPGKPSTFPAVNPPRFRAFYSTTYTIECTYQGNCDPNPPRVGGQYSNRDVSYVGTFLNREFGKVVVLRGKLPRTPRTFDGAKRMGRGQLRYWSLCQNESFATTAGGGCLYDEQVPLKKQRRYTIVTSKRADRPDNARKRCGVGFVAWPARGDGVGHPDDALLFIRNMLPSRGFHRAVQNTEVPGDEREVMGPYLPTATYMSVKKFERKGC